MLCPIRGEDVREGWRFCPQCGKSQTGGDNRASGVTGGAEGSPEAALGVTPDFKPWRCVECGSAFRRACAELVDPTLVLVLLATLMPAVREALGTLQGRGLAWFWVLEIVSIPYRIVADWSQWQATDGKWLFGLR